MGVRENAKGDPRKIWGAESGPYATTANPDRKREADRKGSGAKYLGLRTDRAASTGGIPRGGILGGILDQLIEQVEDQLIEARQCIERYEKAEARALSQLENLKRLQELAEQESPEN